MIRLWLIFIIETVFALSTLCLLFCRPAYGEKSDSGRKFCELRKDNEIILIRTSQEAAAGKLFGEKGALTAVLLAKDTGRIGEIGAEELAKYLPIASGCKIQVYPETDRESIGAKYLVVLATVESGDILNWIGLDVDKSQLPPESCLIAPLPDSFSKSDGIALVGSDARGLLNGCYAFMNKAIGACWDPPRMFSGGDNVWLETTLDQKDQLAWAYGKIIEKPVISDRVFYTGGGAFAKETIDWCSRNNINIFVTSSGTPLPMEKGKRERIKPLIGYAHERGIRVVFLNMTHRLPDERTDMPASSAESLKLSTELYLNQYREFGVDGLGWHTASEGIRLSMDEDYKKRSRVDWEVDYFNSYYKAIRAEYPDALMVMLMGWVYMNPADKIAAMVPKDTIAWVVPNTPIIDAADTDLDAYQREFKRVWYWLYSTVSRDDSYPMVKVDYLEKYCRAAINRGHALAPQSSFGSNSANMMYLARVPWDGLMPNDVFLRYFGERYYGDKRMGQALIDYQNALKDHRSWYNNIHTRKPDMKQLTPSEIGELKSVFRTSLECAAKTSSGLLKDRLKALGITALLCLQKRAPSTEVSQAELEGYAKEANEVFSDHYFGEENDFFWKQLQEISGTSSD